MYSGKDDVREDERDAGRGEEPDGGRCGKGEVAVAKSRVATSSVFTTGFPQEGQKRGLAESSVPQKAQLDIEFSRYSLNQTWDFVPQTSGKPSADKGLSG